MRALIVCQAGKGIGLGHVSRCIVIAASLQHRLGASVQFVIQGEKVQRTEFDALRCDYLEPEANLTQWLCGVTAAELLILDLQPQRLPSDLLPALKRLRSRGIKVVAVDGLLQYRQDLDLIFVPSFLSNVQDGSEGSAPVVSGWDCFLLDDRALPVAWKPGPRVLALTGGSDATGLGQHWPAQLAQALPAQSELHWVTGPFAAAPRFPDQAHVEFRQHIAPQGLTRLMQTMHYAVTIYGVSFFELLKSGIPTVVFSPYCGRDAAELAVIRDIGIAVVASDEIDASKQLSRLMHDHTRAGELSARAAALLAPSGGIRFASEVQALFHES